MYALTTSPRTVSGTQAQDRVLGARLQYRPDADGEAPKNRIAISVWPSAEAEQSFWNDTHDDFKMAQQKYTTDMRLYALEGVAQK